MKLFSAHCAFHCAFFLAHCASEKLWGRTGATKSVIEQRRRGNGSHPPSLVVWLCRARGCRPGARCLGLSAVAWGCSLRFPPTSGGDSLWQEDSASDWWSEAKNILTGSVRMSRRAPAAGLGMFSMFAMGLLLLAIRCCAGHGIPWTIWCEGAVLRRWRWHTYVFPSGCKQGGFLHKEFGS